jgi:hypothetical protein
LSMFGWPRTARPVALDIVFDFVMRDFGGVTPTVKILIIFIIIIILVIQ